MLGDTQTVESQSRSRTAEQLFQICQSQKVVKRQIMNGSLLVSLSSLPENDKHVNTPSVGQLPRIFHKHVTDCMILCSMNQEK